MVVETVVDLVPSVPSSVVDLGVALAQLGRGPPFVWVAATVFALSYHPCLQVAPGPTLIVHRVVAPGEIVKSGKEGVKVSTFLICPHHFSNH